MAKLGLSIGIALLAVCSLRRFGRPGGIEVTMNQAKIVKLSRAADTIVVGNPAIADASVQDASTIVLTGKGFGVTNLVVLDEAGAPIVDEQVTVTRSTASSVRIYRRANRADPVLHALLRKLVQDRRRAAVRNRDEQPVRPRCIAAADAAQLLILA